MKDRKLSAKNKTVKPETNPPDTARLGRDIQAKIGEQLRAMYGDVVDQGVPDRFVELLDQLDAGKKDDGAK